MTPADLERLRSWAIDIVQVLIPGVKWRLEGGERRAVGQGGLTINSQSGAWFHHASRHGGWSVVSLISLLSNYTRADAERWAEAWLTSHAGFGACNTADADDLDLADYARNIIAAAVDPIGTPAEQYLRGRGIEPPYPDCVRFLANARCGEGALVALLSANGRLVGTQLGYLDPSGRKSTIAPIRRRIMAEQAAAAVFDLSNGHSGPVLVAEGIEDALSCAKIGRFPVIGLPGIGTLQHLPIRKGEQIILMRDGDACGSSADKALHDGIDRLLVRGAEIDVTATPANADANSIFAEAGLDALAALVDAASPAELSKPDGLILWAASLDQLSYEQQRKKIAAKAGIRVGALDAERHARRAARSDEPPSNAEADLLDEDVDLDAALNAILAEIARYIVAPESSLAATTLWAAHTHLVHHEMIKLTVSPRLAIQARDYGCGKTLLIEILECLVANPRTVSSITAASVFRVIDALHPTFLIDEADQIIRAGKNVELLAILNASHRRRTAFIDRAVPTSDGKSWEVQKFSVWSAVALAGVGELPPAQQDRSIVINLSKALAKDVKERLKDGESEALLTGQQRLATWAALLTELPDPELPAELQEQAGRVGDNWRPLVAIAALAGGRWPELVQQAITEAIAIEKRPSPIVRLLTSIREAFDALQPGRNEIGKPYADDSPSDRLETEELIKRLLANQDEEWETVNKGRAITRFWLRTNLRGLIDPPGAQDWYTIDPSTPGKKQKHHSGYLRSQFVKSWAAYLIHDPQKPSGVSGVSGSSGVNENNTEADQYVRGNGAVHPMTQPDRSSGVQTNGSQPIDYADNDHLSTPDEPDTPDTPDPPEGMWSIQPNSESGLPDPVADHAKQLAEEHPTWNNKRIARHIGIPVARVDKYLGPRV